MLGAAGVECCTPLCPPFCGCVARGGGKEPRSGRLPRRLSCLAKLVRVWRWLARGLGSPASLLPRPLGESGLEDFLWRNSLKNLSRLYCQLSTERYPEAFSPRLLVDVCFCALCSVPVWKPTLKWRVPVPSPQRRVLDESATSRRVAYLRYLITAGASFLEGTTKSGVFNLVAC